MIQVKSYFTNKSEEMNKKDKKVSFRPHFMLEERNNELKRDTAQEALESSMFDLVDSELSPAQYSGCLKQLSNHLFSAVTVPESSFYS